MRAKAFSLAALLVLAGCSNDVVAPPVEHALGTPVPIRYGHSAIISGEGVGLKFVSLQDGRCPRGGVCLDASLVASSALVGIAVFPVGTGPMPQNAPPPIILWIGGLENGSTAPIGPYDVHLAKLTPYLAAGQVAPPSEYVATIVVTRHE